MAETIQSPMTEKKTTAVASLAVGSSRLGVGCSRRPGRLVVISPETFDPREREVLAELFAAGLKRYHVRKPWVAAGELESWLRGWPEAWRPWLVLHSHPHLVARLGLGGVHFPDVGAGPLSAGSGFTSRACHNLPALRAALGRCSAVLLSPIFPSISKAGYGPSGALPEEELRTLLTARTDGRRRTEVIALGGVTAENARHCLELGFDGVAVLGALWQADDPVRAFEQIKAALGHSEPCVSSHVA